MSELFSSVLSEAWTEANAWIDRRKHGVCTPYVQYIDDPVKFSREICKRKPWKFQRTVLRALKDHRKIQLRTCRDTGKTDLIGGQMTPYFMMTAPTIIITSGPSESQLKDQVWSHVNNVVSIAELPGKCDTLQWRLGARHFAKGIAVGHTGESHKRALGYHASPVVPDDPDSDPSEEEIAMIRDLAEKAGRKGIRLVYLVDECIGVPQTVLEVMIGSMVTDLVWLVLAANPLIEKNEAHEFAYAQSDNSGYFRVMCGAEPADDDAGADVRFTHVPTWLLSPKWIDDRKREWGENSSLTRSHVLGLYSNREDGSDKVIPAALLESALHREGCSDQGTHVGADVAVSNDQFVFSRWRNGVKTHRKAYNNPTGDPQFLMNMADETIRLCKEWECPQEHFHYDKGGVGEGYHSRLHQMGFYADAVDFGGGVENDWPELVGETQCLNRRAELHWIFRRMLQEGLGHLPKEFGESWNEAQWPEVIFKAEGKTGTVVQIQPKKDIKKKYGHSPDDFDADLLAWSRVGNRIPKFRVLKRRW